jgi:phage-related protein
MRLLIDANEISQVAESFRGISSRLVDATKAVRSDAWTKELSSRDLTIRATAEATATSASQIEQHAQLLTEKSTDLDKLANIVRADADGSAPIATLGGSAFSIPRPRITAVPIASVAGTEENLEAARNNLTQVMTPSTPTPEVLSSITTVPTWTAPPPDPNATPVVDQVTQALPEEVLPPKPKKKKGFFGKLFSAIGDWFKKIWGKIKAMLSKMWEGLKGVFKKIWTALKNMKFSTFLKIVAIAALSWTGLPALAGAWLGAGAATAVTAIQTGYQIYSAGRAVYTAATRGIHSLGDVLGLVSAGTGFLRGVGQIGGAIGNAALSAANTISSGFSAISAGASSILNTVTTAIGNIPGAIGDFVGRLLPAAGSLGTIGQTFANAATTAVGWVRDVFTSAGRIVNGVFERIEAPFRNVRGTIDRVIDGLSTSVGQSTNPTLGGLFRHILTQAADQGRMLVTSSWDEIKGIITGGLSDLQNVVTGPLNTVAGVGTGTTGASELVAGLVRNSDLFRRITGAVESVNTINGQIAAIPGQIQATGQQWANHLENARRVLAGLPPLGPNENAPLRPGPVPTPPPLPNPVRPPVPVVPSTVTPAVRNATTTVPAVGWTSMIDRRNEIDQLLRSNLGNVVPSPVKGPLPVCRLPKPGVQPEWIRNIVESATAGTGSVRAA